MFGSGSVTQIEQNEEAFRLISSVIERMKSMEERTYSGDIGDLELCLSLGDMCNRLCKARKLIMTGNSTNC